MLCFFVALPITKTAQANNTNESDTAICQTIKAEAERVCRMCQSGNKTEEVKPKLSTYFNKKTYTCNNLVNLSNNEYFFDRVNCNNIQNTTCTNLNNQALQSPILTTSNQETFNVTDPNSGLLNPDQVGGAFQKAVQNDGPIIGPLLLIINFLTAIIATLAILSIVIGSLFMITARGEESQITRGKDIVKNSLIAVVIVLTSYTLIKLVQATVISVITINS